MNLFYTVCRFLALGKFQDQAFKFQDLNITMKLDKVFILTKKSKFEQFYKMDENDEI